MRVRLTTTYRRLLMHGTAIARLNPMFLRGPDYGRGELGVEIVGLARG